MLHFVDKVTPTHPQDTLKKLVAPQAAPWKYELVYHAVIVSSYIHLAAVYGLYLAVSAAKWYTLYFAAFTAVAAGIGVTAGAHRLWSHRAYKAKPPLQILLMIMQSIAMQYSIITWAKNHRTHHRYCDTDADPHNSTRGFFYSHIGWIFVMSHPDFNKRRRAINSLDLYDNPILMVQHKYTTLFCFTFSCLLPTIMYVYIWEESLSAAWHITMLRYAYTLHATFLITSFAHMFGGRAYDKSITSTQNAFVSLMIHGEGFHNYHHVFPWDYRAAELGNNWLNLSTQFIDFFAWVGWAYDLKTVPDDVIVSRAERTGDGTNSWGFQTKSD